VYGIYLCFSKQLIILKARQYSYDENVRMDEENARDGQRGDDGSTVDFMQNARLCPHLSGQATPSRPAQYVKVRSREVENV
jgi:hypothetical protein